MVNPKNLGMSSEDELMSFATEPMAYEFQSELSDSDQDDHQELLGPVIVDIVTTGLETAETAPPSEPAMPTLASDGAEPPNLADDSLSGDLAEPATGALNGIKNGTAVREKSSGVPRVVGIQVSVPWMSPKQRDDFLYIEPAEEDLSMPRPRRNKVRLVLVNHWFTGMFARGGLRT